MAILLPSLPVIRRFKVPPTDGELYLCELLKEKLDDNYYVFFNPYLDGDRPDIIVLKKKCSAVIIEIKVNINPIGARLFPIIGINLILKIRFKIEVIPIKAKHPKAITDAGTWTYIILTEFPWI